MVRPAKVGRSRGCQPCRKRRIKCDLTEPECDRCVESGRTCPGPLTGVLFIASEKNDNGKIKSKLVRELPPSRKTFGNAYADSSSQAYGAVISQAPFLGPVYENGILIKFLEFFSHNARRSSWTLKLPELKNDPGAHALRSSLRAVSLAYAAHITNDPSIRFEAYRHYGASLRQQRTSLMVLPVVFDLAAAANALLATVVLSYFELISGIAPLAWIEHTTAAERLMVILGPDALRHKIIGQLFYSIRSHSVQRAAIYGQYWAFSGPEWQEHNLSDFLPKQRRSVSRSYYDLLIEYILRLSRCVQGRESSVAQASPTTMLEELENLYENFLTSRGLSVEDTPLLRACSALRPTHIVRDPSHAFHPSLRLNFPAMSASYFHTAAIILLTKFSGLGNAGIDLSYNANTIIAAGDFLSRPSGGNGVAVLRMMLPFSTVWCFLADESIKRKAMKVFRDWSMREGLGGLCGIGFPSRSVSVLQNKPQTTQ